MKTLSLIFLCLLLEGIIPAGDAFLRPVVKRDSILVADRLEYGFCLKDVEKGTNLALPDFSAASNDTLTVVRNWKLDTLSKKKKNASRFDIEGSIEVVPFEEGDYKMPPVFVLKEKDGQTDTLRFDGVGFHVGVFPVDSARVAKNELKPLVVYPVTFGEILPFIGCALLLGLIVYGLVSLLKRRHRGVQAAEKKDPAHIVALRSLDGYRDKKFWAPDRQKAFYSGVTDTLKTYIDERFSIDAPEMTTAELFDSLKDCEEVPEELRSGLKTMFETADFVKFAKYTAPDEENVKVVPLAVRFVTETYQAGLEKEEGGAA